jgi:hypothetical protein
MKEWVRQVLKGWPTARLGGVLSLEPNGGFREGLTSSVSGALRRRMSGPFSFGAKPTLTGGVRIGFASRFYSETAAAA